MFLCGRVNRVFQFVDSDNLRSSSGQPLNLARETLRLAGSNFDWRDKRNAKVLLSVSFYFEVPANTGNGPRRLAFHLD